MSALVDVLDLNKLFPGSNQGLIVLNLKLALKNVDVHSFASEAFGDLQHNLSGLGAQPLFFWSYQTASEHLGGKT